MWDERPKDWGIRRLSEVTERIVRKNDGAGHPVMTISAKRGFMLQSEKFSRDMAGKSEERYLLLKTGEFAYNKGNSLTAPQGCVFRLEEESAVVPFVYYCFSIDEQIDRNYAAHAFQGGVLNRELARSINSGVRNDGLLNLPAEDFFRCQIAVPPLPEQRAIADVLGAVETAISKTEALIEQLKEVTSSFLTDRIASFGDEVTSINVGSILLEGPKSGLSPVCKGDPPGTGVLKLSAVTGGRLNWRDSVKFADIPLKSATQFQLKVGDFLVIRGSGSRDIVGSGCRVTDADLPPFPCIFPDLVIRLRANSKKVIPDYLAVMWDTPVIRGQIRQAAKSTNGIYKINQMDIRELRMPLPPVSVQREIVMLIDGIHARLSAEQRMLVHLVSTRAALAQELLSGRLRLPKSLIARHAATPEQAA